MPYVTGGAAWMVGTTTENCPAGAGGGHCLAKGQYTETGDLSRWGWAYGGGFEMKLGGNVSLFAEYLRMDFGTEKEDKTTDQYRLATQTIGTMVKKFAYCEACACQTISFLLKTKY